MPAPATVTDFIELTRRSNLIEAARLDAYLTTHPTEHETPADLARQLVAAGLLTPFQSEQLLRGKHRGFFLGNYRLLERIGMGGMGQVFLAEHTSMRRRAAVKVLPPDMAANEFSKERFLREARAAGSLDHPNIVRAFDVDSEGEVIFLVMEYIEGISLHDLVSKFGPLDPTRAAYYLWQAAVGLSYVHSAGLIHRDIKPANLLVDRSGTVKILDLGLVRSQADDNELTRGQGVKILGTADFLAPEQAIDCSSVDVRADIYGLGATGYFLLTGKMPYPGDKVAQKLIAHQVMPVPRADVGRSDVPPGLSDVVAKMMAKKPENRFQTPQELAAALEPFISHTPPLPTEQEIPGPVSGIVSPGTVVGLGTRTPRPGQAPVPASGQGSGSGSYVRYYPGDSGIRPGLVGAPSSGRLLPLAPLTPVPTSRPLVAGATAVAEAPPVLPAARTHLFTTDPLADTPMPEVFNPFRLSTQSLVVPIAARVEVPAVKPFRRRLSVAVACVLVASVAAWDVVLITGAISRATTPAGAAPAKTTPVPVGQASKDKSAG